MIYNFKGRYRGTIKIRDGERWFVSWEIIDQVDFDFTHFNPRPLFSVLTASIISHTDRTIYLPNRFYTGPKIIRKPINSTRLNYLQTVIASFVNAGFQVIL